MLSTKLPSDFQAAISKLLEHGSGGHREAAARLSQTYKEGGSASGDFDAYLVTRLPATYAAVMAALEELRRLVPAFAPSRLLDVGSGPGTASWAAKQVLASLGEFTFADNSGPFLDIAREIASLSPSFANAAFVKTDLLKGDPLPPADLVIAAYTLAELPEATIPAAAHLLWKAAQTVVVVEPGTPQGFARVRAARRELIEQGAFIAAPCPHHNACPISGSDWCHFSVRLPRSRAHMHAKNARVPFEDEKFSYVIAMREPVTPAAARVLAQPHVSKASLALKLCTPAGIENRSVARRDRDDYKSARKLKWGDGI